MGDRAGTTDEEEEPSTDIDVSEMPEECRDAVRRVSMYSTRPDRKVFVEDGNCERWISTDETVDVVE